MQDSALQESLDLEATATDAVRLVPTHLRSPDGAITKLNSCRAFHLSPASTAVAAPNGVKASHAGAARNALDVIDRTKNREMQSAPPKAMLELSVRSSLQRHRGRSSNAFPFMRHKMKRPLNADHAPWRTLQRLSVRCVWMEAGLTFATNRNDLLHVKKTPHVRTEASNRRARTATRLVLTLSDGREVRVEDRVRRHGRFMNVDATGATHRFFSAPDGTQYRVKLASAGQASLDAAWLEKQFAKAEEEQSVA